jgi:hypothetical protein
MTPPPKRITIIHFIYLHEEFEGALTCLSTAQERLRSTNTAVGLDPPVLHLLSIGLERFFKSIFQALYHAKHQRYADQGVMKGVKGVKGVKGIQHSVKRAEEAVDSLLDPALDDFDEMSKLDSGFRRTDPVIKGLLDFLEVFARTEKGARYIYLDFIAGESVNHENTPRTGWSRFVDLVLDNTSLDADWKQGNKQFAQHLIKVIRRFLRYHSRRALRALPGSVLASGLQTYAALKDKELDK